MDKYFAHLLSMFRIKRKCKISVGTDCSGIEAPLMALDLLDQEYTHLFSSEIDKNCMEFIYRNFPPNILYEDLKSRDINTMPHVNLYIAGFPCQTFSSLGKNEGFNNELNGTIYFYIWEYIIKKHPDVFILENVRTLETHNKGETFKTIMDSLKYIDEYYITYKTINTKDYGIPQSRNRIFIIGTKKTPFVFPKPFKEPFVKLEDILYSLPSEKISERHEKLMNQIIKKYPEYNFMSEMWILNLNVSNIQWFRKGEKDISPCIVTNSKYYIPKLKRYLSPHEALVLQSIPWRKYDFSGFGKNALYKMAGNTMSVNLMVILLSELINNSL